MILRAQLLTYQNNYTVLTAEHAHHSRAKPRSFVLTCCQALLDKWFSSLLR
jgi:hypothetical protein